MKFQPFSLNLRGSLCSFDEPQVMGILNCTPDSFYAKSRQHTEEKIAARVEQILQEGATMIDIGAYSSRPGAEHIPLSEEMARLRPALKLTKEIAPQLIVSVDTFRSEVATMCVEEYGADIINDISGGQLDDKMFQTVAQLGTPYILMHMIGTPQTMQCAPNYVDLLREICNYFEERLDKLSLLGVNDVIIDPGFGFGKTIKHNYELMSRLSDLKIFEHPLLVGISRKSMIYKLLNFTPEESLNGTTMLNTVALMNGASILRVHDVKEAVEVVKLFNQLHA